MYWNLRKGVSVTVNSKGWWSIIKHYRVFSKDMFFLFSMALVAFRYSPSSSLLSMMYDQWKNLCDAGATTCTLLLTGFRKVGEKFHRVFWLCLFNVFLGFSHFDARNPWCPSFFPFSPPTEGYRWHCVSRNRQTSDITFLHVNSICWIHMLLPFLKINKRFSSKFLVFYINLPGFYSLPDELEEYSQNNFFVPLNFLNRPLLKLQPSVLCLSLWGKEAVESGTDLAIRYPDQIVTLFTVSTEL